MLNSMKGANQLVPTWFYISLGSPEYSLRQGWKWLCLLRQPSKQQGWVKEGCVAMQANACMQWLHHSLSPEKAAWQVCPTGMLGTQTTFCKKKFYLGMVQGREIGQGVCLSFLLHLLFPMGQSSPWGLSNPPLHPLLDWIIWTLGAHSGCQIHML